MKEVYNKIYGMQSSAWRKRRHDFYTRVAGLIDKDDRILDLGCGNGLLANVLGDKFASYFGIDYSDVAIKQAKESNKKAIFFCGNVFDHNYSNYNVVVLMEFLEHIDDDVKLIDLLNPGVKVILTVPNNETVINGKPKGYPIHRRVYNKEIIKSRYSIDFNSIEVYRNWIIAIGIKK